MILVVENFLSGKNDLSKSKTIIRLIPVHISTLGKKIALSLV